MTLYRVSRDKMKTYLLLTVLAENNCQVTKLQKKFHIVGYHKTKKNMMITAPNVQAVAITFLFCIFCFFIILNFCHLFFLMVF